MSLPTQLGSLYDGVARTWSDYFAMATLRPPTNKPILCGYVSTIDRYIHVTESLITQMVTEVGASVEQLWQTINTEGELNEQMGENTDCSKVQTLSLSKSIDTREQLIKLLLFSVKNNVGGKVRIRNNDIVNWLADLFEHFGSRESLGGAPGIMMDTLVNLCGEKNAVIFTVFHSPKQATLYSRDIRFLVIDGNGRLTSKSAEQFHRPNDPEVRNYPLEFFLGEPVFRKAKTNCVVQAEEAERLICTTTYLYYQEDNSIDEAEVETNPIEINRIFQFPGLTDVQRNENVIQIGKQYKHIILSGLQSVPEGKRAAFSQELEMLSRLGVTIHVEVSTPRNLHWLEELIPDYISSLGINEDELPLICTELLDDELDRRCDYSSLWEVYEDALALANKLKLNRLYIHTHTADLILRRSPTNNTVLETEIEADLYAKHIVTQSIKKSSVDLSGPDIGLKQEGLEAFINFMAQIARRGGQQIQQLNQVQNQLDQGHFVAGDYAVVVVPVAWFLGSLPQSLIVTGAGDRTSAVSFIQSGFQRV